MSGRRLSRSGEADIGEGRGNSVRGAVRGLQLRGRLRSRAEEVELGMG
jgi:hypothetical protein